MSMLGTVFVALLLMAVPVAFALGIAATVYLALVHGFALSAVPQRIFAGLDQFILMSIPFYILAGFVMNEAQLTHRLVEFADFLVGRWKAGLAQVTVVTSMFFGGISGAATAEAAAIGSILIPAMTKAGYRRDFATAVTVCASIAGPLIPPSIPMLVYGVSSGASIGALFLAGATPGIAVGLGMLVLNRYLARNLPTTGRERLSLTVTEGFLSFWRSLRSALLAIAMPIIILSGIVGGVFTPTESSVAAVVYAVAVGLMLRTVSLASLGRLLVSTAIISATVMFIIANANVIGWVMAFERIPQAIAELFLSFTENRYVFLLLVAGLLLLVGLFLETSGAIIILTPVLLPAADAYGIDPVHFGVVIVFGLVIGLVTPPVGLCLFIGCSIGQVGLHQLVRATFPFLIMLLMLYTIFLFVPAASLWLPQMIMG